MTFELSKPKLIVLNGYVYTVEGYTIHNHIKYANAHRKAHGLLIEVDNFELRKALGGRLN